MANNVAIRDCVGLCVAMPTGLGCAIRYDVRRCSLACSEFSLSSFCFFGVPRVMCYFIQLSGKVSTRKCPILLIPLSLIRQ